jgi:hypothetical protein
MIYLELEDVMIRLKSLVFLSIVLLLALGALHCDDPEVGDDDDDSFADEDDDDYLNDDVDDDIDDDANDDLNDDIDDDLNDDADDDVDDDVNDDVDDDVDDDADVLEPLCPALPWSDNTVELPIRLQNGPELTTFGFSVNFPSSSIRFSEVRNGTILAPNQIRCAAEGGGAFVVCVVDPLPAPLAAGTDGLIARIEFTVNDSPATASFQIYDLSGDLAGHPDSQCDSQ